VVDRIILRVVVTSREIMFKSYQMLFIEHISIDLIPHFRRK